MAKRKTEIEPTPEDFERVDDSVKHGRDNLRYILAKRYAEERVRREQEVRRRAGFLRRILRFGRA